MEAAHRWHVAPRSMRRRPGELAVAVSVLAACCDVCRGAASGGPQLVRLESLAGRLSSLGEEMDARHHTLAGLEALRSGILSGERVPLPSAQRLDLERASHVLGEVSIDARHRPVSDNATRHFQHVRTLAEDVRVRLHAFMPLKRATSSGSRSAGPTALLLTVGEDSAFSIFDPDVDGKAVLGPLDLGHGAGRAVTRMATTSSQESHYVITVDSANVGRVHSLRVLARREARPQAPKNASQAPAELRLNVTLNFTSEFRLPDTVVGPHGEAPTITAVLPVDRGEKTHVLVGDSLGGVTVFYKNGTLKGRVRVCEDPGGVRGLVKGHSQSTLFFSSHSFGFFSVSQVDAQSPPCVGWNSPVVDMVLDPNAQNPRVILALADGDVIAFATTHGKSKACDLLLKFPHVSTLPLRLQSFRGHVMGVPMALENSPRQAEHLREIMFFNLAAMENGYGATASNAVTVQAAFRPQQPRDVALAPSPTGDRSQAQAAISFEGRAGLELYTLSLKLPAALQEVVQVVEPQYTDPDEVGSWSSFLGWFPKIGVFGVVLVGVVLWNIRKAYSSPTDDEFDEEFFHEQLRKARAAEEAERRGKAGGAG